MNEGHIKKTNAFLQSETLQNNQNASESLILLKYDKGIFSHFFNSECCKFLHEPYYFGVKIGRTVDKKDSFILEINHTNYLKNHDSKSDQFTKVLKLYNTKKLKECSTNIEGIKLDVNKLIYGKAVNKISNGYYLFTAEEALYLCMNGMCMFDLKNSKKEFYTELLSQFSDGSFIPRFFLFAALRKRKWIIKPGIIYGCDFMLYRDSPDYCHSKYGIICRCECDNKSLEFKDIVDKQRILHSVKKKLLIATTKCFCNDLTSYENFEKIFTDNEFDEIKLREFEFQQMI